MKKRGVGIAYVVHPTGNKGAGDPSQAAIRMKPDGTYTLMIGAVDLGQGSTTILRQFAADALGVPIEKIYVSNHSEDFLPLSLGSFASRVTLIDPHAVVNAAEDLRRRIREWAANEFECHPDDVEIEGQEVFVKGDRERSSKTMDDVASESNFGGGANPGLLVGTGAWQPAKFEGHDPITGAMTAVGAVSFGTAIAEVEVDTETGQVDVLKFVQVWEVGKAVNPLMVRQQINGGYCIGGGLALSENVYPYYPTENFAPEKMGDYFMPTFEDYPQEMLWGFEEVPHPNGVQGAKGFSEGSANAPPPAIVSAIHDAIGVWVKEIPATPEAILRALEEKRRKEHPLEALKDAVEDVIEGVADLFD
ncbi:MAG TPA: molybdopterin cofactor-binding domain-containing protein [Anaerolineae bacterium]|nr:molybdopterin cofactor-binding domain-containing protein [Anaerolineae bacterium]